MLNSIEDAILAEKMSIEFAQERISAIERLPGLNQQEIEKHIKIISKGKVFKPGEENIPVWPKIDNPIIEMGGLPHLGKTSCFEAIKSILNANGVAAHLIREPHIPWVKRGDSLSYESVLRNRAIAHLAITEMLRLKESGEAKSRTILMDRGILSQIAFEDMYARLHIIREDEASLATNYITNLYKKYLSGLIIVTSSPSTSYENATTQSYMRMDEIEILRQAYEVLPTTIAKTERVYYRGTAISSLIPALIVAQINVDEVQDEYPSLLLKTVGTIHKWCLADNIPF